MRDLARELYAAYNSHDLDAVGALYMPNGSHTDVSQDRTQVGPADITAGLQHFFRWFPDAKWTPSLYISDPHGSVAVPYTLTATLQAPMGPILARGQSISIRGVHIVHSTAQLILSTEDYWDTATFQRQINHTHKENQ